MSSLFCRVLYSINLTPAPHRKPLYYRSLSLDCDPPSRCPLFRTILDNRPQSLRLPLILLLRNSGTGRRFCGIPWTFAVSKMTFLTILAVLDDAYYGVHIYFCTNESGLRRFSGDWPGGGRNRPFCHPHSLPGFIREFRIEYVLCGRC